MLLFYSCKKNDIINDASIPSNNVINNDTTHTTQNTPYYTGDLNQLPKFSGVCYFEFDSLDKVSKFRSGFGHDYSDDFEFCRSMKHYFVPKNLSSPGTDINIYSPFRGVVTTIWQEWAGSQIHISSVEYPAFSAKIFHVNLLQGIAVGDTLQEGLLIGKHIGNVTSSDIAIAVMTPTDGPKDSSISQSGLRYVSYFSIMKDNLLQRFMLHGVTLDSLIIRSSERDSFPLNCNGEVFLDQGSINNWVPMQ